MLIALLNSRCRFQNGAPTYCGPSRKTAVIAKAAIAAAIKMKSKRSNSTDAPYNTYFKANLSQERKAPNRQQRSNDKPRPRHIHGNGVGSNLHSPAIIKPPAMHDRHYGEDE